LSNADVTKQALVWLQKEIDDNKYPVKIILVVHDSIVTECKDEFAEEWKAIFEDIMIKAGELLIKSIPVKVDTYIAKSWKK
jgi:DNA polymerase-1